MRKHLLTAVKEALEDKELSCTPESKEVAETAVDAALDYVLDFAREVSQELITMGLYSESMVAGVFTSKIKSLKNTKFE